MKANYIIIPVIAFSTAALGGYFTDLGMGWYKTLNLPSWTPSGAVIGTVWTIIFILSTVSALIVWNKFKHNKRFWWIVTIFILNAFLNLFWSFLFFTSHLMSASIFEMVILEATVIALIILIWAGSKTASLLLVPYAGWVVFATYSAYNVWSLNK